ncbi:sigma-54 interaction domain-containing protein [Clostridium fermenticellae]|uniref:sigma-54 interaction domain-containing protein n=1 Tax=Clostridium fermenticellae TaxID=2068654 RepID=UPI0013C46654|nr:sigma 54-interacting transcriptional regulator [Clostridium fermenticellae]
METFKKITSKKIDRLFIKINDIIFNQIPIPICLVNSECKIVTFNNSFKDYFNLKLENEKGKFVGEVDPNARFPVILKTGKAEINRKHKFQGRDIIVHRLPLHFNNKLIGGISITIIGDLNYIYRLVTENNLIKNLKSYKNNQSAISEVYKAKYTFDDILSNSNCLNNCKEQAKSFAETDLTVLITGESGVGKELFAHSIHNYSKRRKNPFISINCAAIPESLIESELFGHEEGSFTGATKNGRMGKFELANTGTIFLDEIGDLPLKMQVKLLRVLQEKEIERVGGNKIINLDIRVIAATNCDLQEKVNSGTFRKDLFYRLNVLNLEIPPLRERPSDISLLIDNFINNFYKKYGICGEFTEDVLKTLCLYKWPGNVRELRNIVERMLVISKEHSIKVDSIPENILNSSKESMDANIKQLIKTKTFSPLKSSVFKTEKELIINTLIENNFNKSKTAEILGIPRMTLYRKLKEINLK